MQRITFQKNTNSEIEYYTLIFEENKFRVELNINMLANVFNVNKAKIVNSLKKFNASITNLPYFMEQQDAEKAADYFNGLYVAKVLIDGGGE